MILGKHLARLWRSLWLWAVCSAMAMAGAAHASTKDYAVTVYAGKMTDNDWLHAIIPINVDFVDSYLLTGAVSRTLHRSATLPLSYEVEGQVVKHSGEQDNWEYNLLAAARWHRFPWNDRLRTTAAFGVGPSYASSLPNFEVISNGGTERWLAYWYMELTLGPPDEDWSMSLRLHHRSTAFGLFGRHGGYDALAIGVRYPF
jgi:hypothetical protein